MGIANNTIVVYTTDNGPHMNTWPDGAMTWFRSEKNTNWEGAFRVPCFVRWPGVIEPGTVTNELMSHNDWVPTLCAIAGEPDIVDKLKQGYTANGLDYKVHLDGYDQSEFLRTVRGTAADNNGVKSARDKFFYSDDDGLLVAHALGRLQVRLLRAAGTRHDAGLGRAVHDAAPAEDLQPVPGPVRARRHHLQHLLGLATSTTSCCMYGVMDEVFKFVETFKEFPPRSFPPSFNPANIMESTMDASSNAGAEGELDLERIRGGLNRMIDEALQHRGAQ